MHKLSRADVLIINGLGLEEFLGAPVRKANPRIQILDSSAGIKDILRYSHAEGMTMKAMPTAMPTSIPHLFASPRMAARLTLTIAEGAGTHRPRLTRISMPAMPKPMPHA